jgi:hypothetical protein
LTIKSALVAAGNLENIRDPWGRGNGWYWGIIDRSMRRL